MAHESNDVDVNEFDDGEPSPHSGPLVSGKWAVILVGIVGVIGAASGWLYLYDQKRVPREFWGFESPRIFVEAEKVTALLIKPEAPEVAQKLPYHDDLYLVDAARYVVVERIDITNRENLPALRHALTDHRNFDSGRKSWKEPEWRFGLIFENHHEASGAKYTASIVFDSDCMLGRPQTVEKTISTAPMSASLLAFFEGVFPAAKAMPKTTPPEAMVNPLPKQDVAQPAPNPGGVILPPDADVITLRKGEQTGVVNVPRGTGVSGRGPVVVPTVPQLPFIQGVRQPSGITLPGSSPNPLSQGITLPPGSGLDTGPSRSNPFPVGPPIDLSTPRNVTVPRLEGGAPLGPPNGSGT